MPYNELGYFTLTNLRRWSESAIECYRNKLMCRYCTLPEDLKTQCKMKAVVIELFKKYGKPDEERQTDEKP